MNTTESSTTAAPAAWLESHARGVAAERDDWAQKETRASWSRLAVFVAGLLVWVFLAGQPLLALGLTAVVVVAFVYVVRRHAAHRAEREFRDRLVQMCDESRQRVGGRVVCVRDWRLPEDDSAIDGALPQSLPDGDLWALTAQERDDLDLFAPPVGIFGLLNRTSTSPGARRLRDVLMRPLLSSERILARQQCVRWLAEHPEPRLRLLAGCAVLRNEDKRLAALVQAVRDVRSLKLFASPRWLRVWSLLTGLVFLLASLQTLAGQFAWGAVLLLVLAINAVIYIRIAGAVREAIAPWADVSWAARGLLSVARLADRDLPEESELGLLRRRFVSVEAGEVLSSLTRRIGWAEGGGPMQFFLNLVVLYEVHVAEAILHRAVPHRDKLLASIAALAELEMLLSLGTFAWEQPRTCWPVPQAGESLLIRGGCHPLVDPQRAVPNDVRLDGQRRLWIVTGSNMAGKSTLLRMTAINTLFAQLGGAALADELRWTPMRLLTDLRASDNLAASESYFLSEVRHLRRMVLPPVGTAPLLGLIDEPFRGTNSQEQTAASVAVVRHLIESGNLFMLATHDRYLTLLADGQMARNYHFRENLGSDGMVFDYRLHEGPATTRNALRVLEREGYPAELLEEARGWLAKVSSDLRVPSSEFEVPSSEC